MVSHKMKTALAALAILAFAAPAGAGTPDVQQVRPVDIAPAWAAPDAMADLVSEHASPGMVDFLPGTAILTAESRRQLDLLPHLLPQNDALLLTIASTGNGPLAEARAVAVQDYLASRGVTETRLEVPQPADIIAVDSGTVRIQFGSTAG